MEAAHRKNLRLSRQKIVDDLDVSDVIDHLLENSIVDEEDYQRILAEKTRKARARSLLDLLAVRGPRAYPVFVAALQESYCWLAAGLEVGTGYGGEEADSNDRGGEELVALLTRGGVPHPPRTPHPPHQGAAGGAGRPRPAAAKQVSHSSRHAGLWQVRPCRRIRQRSSTNTQQLPGRSLLVQSIQIYIFASTCVQELRSTSMLFMYS